MAGECQQITDRNQWTTVRTGMLSFPASSLELLKHPAAWYTGECRATSCLSCSATLSKFPRFHSNYTANVVFQGQDMHAFFIHHHKQARNERKSFRRYRSVTENVHVGIERNRAIPTKWRTGSSRRCVGGSRHMVDWEWDFGRNGKNRKHPSRESNPGRQQTRLMLHHWVTETSVITSQFVWNSIRSASTSQ